MDGFFSRCFLLIKKKKESVKLKKAQKSGHPVKVPVHHGSYPISEKEARAGKQSC